jgi:hypothetical protein
MPTSAWNIPDKSTDISILRFPYNPTGTPIPAICIPGIANISKLFTISLVQLHEYLADTVAFAIVENVIPSFIQLSYSKSVGTA